MRGFPVLDSLYRFVDFHSPVLDELQLICRRVANSGSGGLQKNRSLSIHAGKAIVVPGAVGGVGVDVVWVVLGGVIALRVERAHMLM